MLSLVAALTLAAGIEASEPPAAALTPRAVIYGYPTSTAAMIGLKAVDQSSWGLCATLGSSVRLTEKLGVDLELTAGALHKNGFQDIPGWIVSAGVGPSLQLTGDEAFRGLFVATRLRFEAFQPAQLVVFRSAGQGPVDLGPGVARAFLGELDVGYHFRFGRFYFAPIVGVGVGYAYDYVDSTGVSFLSPLTNPSTSLHRPQGIVWTLNLNLARIGLAI
jgi:hypothetical protein